MYITYGNELTYIHPYGIVSLILGIVFLLFAEKVSYLTKYFGPLSIRPVSIRIFSFFLLIISYTPLGTPPPHYVNKDGNRLALLESGKIIKGQVTKSYFATGAPKGWKIVYNFETEDPSTGENKKLLGSSQGPGKYYRELSKGDTVEIIYNPLAPKVNCEIMRFLNYPGFRQTFEKAGKLNLLNKFKDKYELENYSDAIWYDLQQNK